MRLLFLRLLKCELLFRAAISDGARKLSNTCTNLEGRRHMGLLREGGREGGRGKRVLTWVAVLR